jgi:UDP-N-acetylmuramoylalanine--D-glutamate ligase
MPDLADKHVVVLGLSEGGAAACGLLCRAGARVVASDSGDDPALRVRAEGVRALGVRVLLKNTAPAQGSFDFAVVSPEIPSCATEVTALARRGVPLMGELELGLQQAKCLTLVVAGTNGKSTTGEMIEHMLASNDRKVLRAGHAGCPIGSMADQTADADFLVVQANALQLESARSVAPAVAVLLNVHPDHADRFPDAREYVRVYAKLFEQQQPFDWAIVQAEAWTQLKQVSPEPACKVITFSARHQKADLYLDRGLILSRLPNWEGPLLDTAQCRLQGPHNAENMMATLAVGRALRLSLENMVSSLKVEPPAPHRCEIVSEVNGVQFVNDARATNPAALQHALLTVRSGEGGRPNIWLIAGGRERSGDFHSIGPLISQRVKGAFLIGEAREKIRAAWSLFTPCTLADSLLEAVTEAAKNATSGDAVLLSPACSSLDQFQSDQQRGEWFCRAVESISRGAAARHPNINGSF